MEETETNVNISLDRESIAAVLRTQIEQSQQDLEDWELIAVKASDYKGLYRAERMKGIYKGQIKAYKVAIALLMPFSIDIDDPDL